MLPELKLKFRGLLNGLLTVTVLQQAGTRRLHSEVQTYEGLVKAPGLHRLGMYKCVLGIYAAVLRCTIIQLTFKEAMVNLSDKQKLPCMYEEDDIFSNYKLAN